MADALAEAGTGLVLCRINSIPTTYHWSDVLAEDATSGGEYSAALREFAGQP